MPESTIQPSASAGIDTYITEEFKTSNYGTATTIRVAVTGDPYKRRSLLKFDLSAIAPGSVIQQAKLTLYVSSAAPDSSTWTIARILAANSGWAETSATWNTIDGSTSWAGSAGCQTAGTDYDQDNYLLGPNYSTGTFGSPAFITVTLEATAFQKLIDIANDGFIIFGTGNANISSSDHATASQRPSLYVRWLEPKGRLVEYTFNIWDPQQRVLDAKGAAVQPNEIRPNNWIRVWGFELPRGRAYASLVTDPSVSYIVGTTYDEERQSVDIKTNRNQFADMLLRRLSR